MEKKIRKTWSEDLRNGTNYLITLFLILFAREFCANKITPYDDFLFPQYEDKFDKTISEETWTSIQEAAKNNLENDDGFACGPVMRHWKSIVEGVVPFGYRVGKMG